MKKWKMILLMMTMVGVSSVGHSQIDEKEDTREDLKFGLRFGGNLSNVWDEQSEDFEADNKFGFAGGAYMSIPLGKFLGVQPNLLFSQKGFQGEDSFLGQRYSFSRTTNYIDVPVLFELKPSKHLTIVAGPQYSYLISKTDEFTSGTISGSDYEEFENENIRRNTMGVLVGFDVHASDFIISPRAGWDLQNNNGDGTSSTPRYKNQWIQLTLGYEF